MERDQIFEGVASVLEESLGVTPEMIKPSTSLAGELGADSLDVMDIVVRLNRRFSLKLSARELAEQLRESDLPAMAAGAGGGSFSSSTVPTEVQLESSRKIAELVTVDFLVNTVDIYLRAGAQAG
jgi:acyl carrier protein